jgi:hypothetical protein
MASLREEKEETSPPPEAALQNRSLREGKGCVHEEIVIDEGGRGTVQTLGYVI